MTRHLPLNALCEECQDAAELHAPGRCLAEGCTCAGFVFQGVVAIDTFAGATVVERVGVPMPGRRAEVPSAPLPEPEPDPRVAVVLEWADDQGDDINAESLLARLDALAARGYLERPKAGA